MPWNYRVIHRKHANDEDTYAIHEVYYNDYGEITLWSQDGIEPAGLTLEELRADIDMQRAALTKPILEWKELEAQAQKDKEGNHDTATTRPID